MTRTRTSSRRRLCAKVNITFMAGSSGGRCLYVSGVPGTGKTATVLETMRGLRRKAEAGHLPAFQFVEINSLRLPSPQHAYTHLYEVPSFLFPHQCTCKRLRCC